MMTDTPRRTGRPDQQASEELLHHIVDTAARLFIDQGYAATSIEQIAAAAGSGKQTIYRRFTSKEGLFTAVINRQSERLLDVAQRAETTRANPLEALEESCRSLYDFVLQPDMVRLHRILIAEVGRFPDLGEYVLENCLGPFRDLQKRLLEAAMAKGLVRPMELELAMALLGSLITGWPVQKVMLGCEPFAPPLDRDTYFAAAWKLFLKGAA